jgi:4,5-dihydroxyphthalate decarboxylase
MTRLALSLAIGEYDHVADLVQGRLPTAGFDLLAVPLPAEEAFHRFLRHGEFDVAEVSLGRYLAARDAGDDSVTALAVFPSRAFRHSMFYVREDSPIRSLADLAGRRIGLPDWAQTAAVWGRGILESSGVPLMGIDWVQAGLLEPGRRGTRPAAPPAGLRLRLESARTLEALLFAGEIDCVMSAAAPAAFLEGRGIARLLPDYRAHEEAWQARTGIFPIMHAVAVRTALLDRHPWLARALFLAFDEARRRSMRRLDVIGLSAAPLPWLKDSCDRARARFGEDWCPYGLEANRITLQALCRWAAAQGVTRQVADPGALFLEQAPAARAG